MSNWSWTFGQIGVWLVRSRWPLAGFISLTSVAAELAERQPSLLFHVDLLIFAVIFPSLVGIALSAVARAQSRMDQARKDAVEAERRQLARDLHDSLGQQLAYLQLKLEQLTAKDAETDIAVIRQQMHHMRSVVKEAYTLVRSTLLDLDTPLQTDLISALQELAERVGARAGFKVSFASRGRSTPLSRHLQRHVVYIVREALANTERHASAGRVTIKLTWTDDSVLIQLVDDGVGFEPGKVSMSDHLGLALMQERADEIGARLVISSDPGDGAQLQLSVPLAGVTEPMPQIPGAEQPAAGSEPGRARP